MIGLSSLLRLMLLVNHVVPVKQKGNNMPIKQPKKDKYSTLYIRDVPDKIKNQFKAWCAANGITMHQQIVDLMKRTIEGMK